MKKTAHCLIVVLLAVPATMLGQSYTSSSSFASADAGAEGFGSVTPSPVRGPSRGSDGLLSRVSFGGGISPLGIQVETTGYLNRHFNLRGTGDFFSYSDNFTTNGINATAKLNLGTVRAAVDVYPFHRGWRISPGIMFHNQNRVTGATDVPAGTSFTLDGTTYYSANPNPATGATPVTGYGILGLNTNRPAFTVTTGWGNQIPRNGHWSFPLEIGVAFIGDPSVNVTLGGWACYDQAQTQCANLSDPTDPIANMVQSSLSAQVAKWRSDLQPLNTFPILSGGVAYSFHVR